MELPKYLYLEVTRDKYALPVHVCDNVKELSEESGVSVIAINNSLHNFRKGAKHTRFIEVLVNPNGVKYGSKDIRYNVYKKIKGSHLYMLIIRNQLINVVSKKTNIPANELIKAEAFENGFIKEYKIEKVLNGK